MNLKAKVQYRNRRQEVLQEVDYLLQDYTDVLSMDMKRIISDIEDLVYTANGGKSKEDWSEGELTQFNKIRCKLLDKAGELSRLPGCIYDGDTAADTGAPSSFWERIFNEKRS